jgi:hypothetical protein
MGGEQAVRTPALAVETPVVVLGTGLKQEPCRSDKHFPAAVAVAPKILIWRKASLNGMVLPS